MQQLEGTHHAFLIQRAGTCSRGCRGREGWKETLGRENYLLLSPQELVFPSMTLTATSVMVSLDLFLVIVACRSAIQEVILWWLSFIKENT